MVEREDERAEVLRLQREWLEARSAHSEITKQFVWTGAVQPGQPIGRPPRVFDLEGVVEVKAAAEREDAAFRAYREALAGYMEGNR